jgi:hypothetical protein
VPVDATWFDLVMITLLAGVVVIGARRGVAGLVAGLGAMLVWAIVNIVAGVEPLLGLLLAAGAGFGLAMLAKYFNTLPIFQTDSEWVSIGLGAVGGLILGLGLVAALSLGFPTRPNPSAGRGGFFYPSDSLPNWIYDGVKQSVIQQTLSKGRNNGGLGIWTSSKTIRAFLLPDRNR